MDGNTLKKHVLALLITLFLPIFLFADFHAQAHSGLPGKYIPMHDTDPWIPNLVYGSVFKSACATTFCNWDDPLTWTTHVVPNGNDRVIISPDDVVIIRNENAIAHSIGVYPGGKLKFANNVKTELKVVNLQVLGELEIGTEQNPIQDNVTAIITFRDVPLDTGTVGTPGRDPAQYGNGLLTVMESVIRMHGRPLSRTWVRLAEEPVGATLKLEEPVTGWKPGDEILLPDTEEKNVRFSNEELPTENFSPKWEEVKIQSVSGNTVVLQSPLAFNHRGYRNLDDANKVDIFPHVANLSRNIILRSENPAGARGHTFFGDASDVDIRYVRFKDLGRTRGGKNVFNNSLAPNNLNNTTFDTSGNPTHIGTNQIARYALHTHHLMGPGLAKPGGYQSLLIGNTVDETAALQPFKWGIAIHGTHYAHFKDNVVYNVSGSGIVTEDGSESNNLIERNFTMRIHGTYQAIVEDIKEGIGGYGFWFRGVHKNIIRDNVAVNSVVGFNFQRANLPVIPPTKIPAFQGSNIHAGGPAITFPSNEVPIAEFSNNEAYGAMDRILDVWSIGANFENVGNVGISTIKNLRGWNFYGDGINLYRPHRIVFDGIILRGRTAQETTGIDLTSGYRARGLVFRNLDIQGLRRGVWIGQATVPADLVGDLDTINIPSNRFGEYLFENSYFRNHRNIMIWNVFFREKRHRNGSPRKLVFNNVKFDSFRIMPGINHPLQDFAYDYFIWPLSNVKQADYTKRDVVLVYNHNQVPGANYRLYFDQQRPNTPFIQTAPHELSIWEGRVGCPEANLTNTQCLAKYGVTFAGETAPCVDNACSNATSLAKTNLLAFRLPQPNAGTDIAIPNTGPVDLNGSVIDPNLIKNFVVHWTKKEGPGDVLFDDPGSLSTRVRFSKAGNYVLSLQTSNDTYNVSDDVVVAANLGAAGEEITPAFVNVFYPLKESLIIPYILDGEQNVEVKIYSRQGELIKTISSSPGTGLQRTEWDGKNEEGKFVASGTYFLTLRANGKTERKKFVVLK